MASSPFPSLAGAFLLGALLLASTIAVGVAAPVPGVAGPMPDVAARLASANAPFPAARASTLRLLPTDARDADGALRAGLVIALAPGWKTYWRYPGEAGVPPRFDFSASTNVKAVHVAWPAPVRFVEDGVTSIGYTHDVVFPLRVEAAEPGKPMVLRVRADYAVCEKLCLPVEGRAEARLGEPGPPAEASPADAKALKAAEARVPRSVALGAEAPLAISAAQTQAGFPPRVVVDVKAPEGAVDLFAEGPTAEWSLPLPEKVPGAPDGQQRFAFALDGLPEGAAVHGAPLTLTAVSPQGAVETTIRLD